MSDFRNQPIEERMHAAQTMINNTLDDPDLMAALSQFGYGEDKVQAGKHLVDQVQTLGHQQLIEYGIQYEATEEMKKAWATAKKAYMRTLKVARIALAGNLKAESALQLRGRRKVGLAEWLDQATTFYTNLLHDADLLGQMAEYGYNPAKLEAEADLVRAVVAARVTQKQNKGNARQATGRRNAKLTELEAWLSDFRAILRVATEDNPTWLKKLGM